MRTPRCQTAAFFHGTWAVVYRGDTANVLSPAAWFMLASGTQEHLMFLLTSTNLKQSRQSLLLPNFKQYVSWQNFQGMNVEG
jgi:hypothetical protein